MSLTKVDHSRVLPRLSNLWEDFFGRDITDHTQWSLPAVNVEEKPEAFEVTLAAPGMQRDDFKIEVRDGVLSVVSEKEDKHEEADKKGKYVRREFSYQSFSRTFTLPEAVNEDKIVAQYKDGILSVQLPKKEPTAVQATRQIEVQ